MEPKNQCPRCLKFFSSQQRFQSHFHSQTNCHMKAYQLTCSFCQKSFSRKSCLNKHLEKHGDSTSYQTMKPLFPIKLKLKTDHNDNDFKHQGETTVVTGVSSQEIDELIEKQ